MSSACLTIRTGLQGNGKTLNTIKEVDLQAKKEGRVVYYHNVTGLDPKKLQAHWYEFDDPTKWFELPNDSIIVIDEAQGDPSEGKIWFGFREPRVPIPAHVSRFATMRKQGHEVHLITQDPRMLDVHARRLCNCHIHYWRIFGSSKIARYEMPRIKDDVEKLSTFKDASRTILTLDKRFFDVYTSAQAQHHFKFKPSRKLVMIFFIFLVAAVLFYRAYDTIFGSAAPAPAAPASGGAAPGAVGQAMAAAKTLLPGIAPTGEGAKKTLTKAEWLAARVPRIPDDPASAPVYDDLTKPQSYPRLSCVASEDQELLGRASTRMQVAQNAKGKKLGCQCYTQQGSRYKTSFDYCLNVVKNGYFDAARPDPVAQVHQGQQQPQQRALAQQRGNSPKPSQVPQLDPVLAPSSPAPTVDSPGGAPTATYVPAVVPGAPSSVPAASGVGIAWIQ